MRFLIKSKSYSGKTFIISEFGVTLRELLESNDCRSMVYIFPENYNQNSDSIEIIRRTCFNAKTMSVDFLFDLYYVNISRNYKKISIIKLKDLSIEEFVMQSTPFIKKLKFSCFF